MNHLYHITSSPPFSFSQLLHRLNFRARVFGFGVRATYTILTLKYLLSTGMNHNNFSSLSFSGGGGGGREFVRPGTRNEIDRFSKIQDGGRGTFFGEWVD